MERPTGLEPVSPAWEAGAQPIYQGRFQSEGTTEVSGLQTRPNRGYRFALANPGSNDCPN